MSNKWIGGLKYTYLGNLKAMETKEGLKPVKEMLHELWHELHGLRLQTRADKILIDSIGKEMDERQDEVKALRAELREMKRKYAWVSEPCTSQVPSDTIGCITRLLGEQTHFHRGGLVSSMPPGLMGEVPLSSIGRTFGTAIIPREMTEGHIRPPKLTDILKMGDLSSPAPPFPKVGDTTVDLLSIAPDLKKK